MISSNISWLAGRHPSSERALVGRKCWCEFGALGAFGAVDGTDSVKRISLTTSPRKREKKKKCPGALCLKPGTIQFAGPLATVGGELLIKRSITPQETNYSKCLT